MIRRYIMLLTLVYTAVAVDTNNMFSPCTDSRIQRNDGFTIGLAFSSKDKFFFNQTQTQLSPCDGRLQLSSVDAAQLAVYRPKVDEISILTLDTTFNPSKSGGYMVAFAGQKYAARSLPTFIADDTRVVTRFTLVLEFQSGILFNLFWKKYGCSSCKRQDGMVCVEQEDCAVLTPKCKANGGPVDCRVGIQLMFFGTDKHNQVQNSWYEQTSLGKYSLLGLFSGLGN